MLMVDGARMQVLSYLFFLFRFNAAGDNCCITVVTIDTSFLQTSPWC